MTIFHATHASADFSICNNSQKNIRAVLGYNDKDFGWTSDGWFDIARGTCESLVGGDVSNAKFYVYAVDDQTGVWDAGDAQRGGFFCVSNDSFSYHSRDYVTAGDKPDCERAGLRTRHFSEVTTGGDFDYIDNLNQDPPK